MVPYDKRSPMITSGIRIGTPAMTTRGMGVDEMVRIVDLIDSVIQAPDDELVTENVRNEVKEMCDQFPLYSELG